MSNAPVPELQYFGPTAIVFGLISILVYILVIRPLLPTPNTNNNNNNNNRTGGGGARLAPGGAGAQTNGGAARQHRLPAQPAADGNNNNNSNNNNSQPPRKCTRSPPHLNTDTVTAVNNGVNVLVDGVVAFKYTKAAAAANANSDAVDRKARARLLANLLSDSSKNSSGSISTSAATAPPAKGGCVAVAIPYDPNNNNSTLQCEQQRRALVLLASYYNLMVLVAVDDGGDDESARKDDSKFDPDAAVAQLRGAALTQDLLPRHRIVFTSTVTGRVAFVRQLQRIELVLDFDPEVKGLLSRFGHRVIVYGGGGGGGGVGVGSEKDGGASISKLGRALL